MPDAEMSSVDPTLDKLTQCEKEKFSLISAANHLEWLRDPLDGGRRPHWVQMRGMAGDTEGLLWLVKGISGSSRSTRNQPLSDYKAVARSGAPRPHTCGQYAAKAADQFVQKVQLTELAPV